MYYFILKEEEEDIFNVCEAKDSLWDNRSNQNRLLEISFLPMQVDDECSQLLNILATK